MLSSLFLLAGVSTAQIGPGQGISPQRPNDFESVVMRVSDMVRDATAQRLAAARDLQVMNLTWEDTGRYKGSSVGPNISDMTIQVGIPIGRGQIRTVAMPVIRFPNFSDKTADIDPRMFSLLIGNEKGRRLQRISLYDFLAAPAQFMSRPVTWNSRRKTLLASRDSHMLASAQACFLPVPQAGKATFNPVVFNYQSSPDNPAVLTILATREGTSMTIIENRDQGRGTTWGQPLFFNKNGQRASFTGERLSDFASRPENAQAASQPGLNMVLLIQVPLKYKETWRGGQMAGGGGMEGATATPSMARGGGGGSDVEAAVIGHGELEGPFGEFNNLDIVRDDRFPVRVTVQFYKATSNGIVSARDMNEIKSQIDEVYAYGDSVGSLVTGGETGRPTEYWGMKTQPAGWWRDFWSRHQKNTGETPDVAREKLRRLLGERYMDRPVCELYLNDCLRSKSR